MSGQQAENTLHENAIGWIILLIVIAVLLYILWYFKAEEIRNIIRWIRYGEMWIMSWFIKGWELITAEPYTIPYNGEPRPWVGYFESIPTWNKAQLTNALGLINTLTFYPLRWIIIALCGLGALWCLFRGPQSHNRVRLGLEGLIARQAHNFPVIAPFVDFNPSNQPPRPPGSPVPAELPQFAEALGPEEWLAYTGNTAADGKVDEESAAKHFQKQLIGRWKGWKALKPYQQILLASFALKAARKRDASDVLLGRITLCWSAKDGLKLSKDRHLLSEARKILNNKDLAGSTLQACNRHAFITTAMLGALNHARSEGGVLAPAQFVWLRGHDRVLWYPLNNLGRHSHHIEALGAMSHYKAERLTQRPIPTPKIEDAVESITEYMKSQKRRPIPALDYSGSKKRGIKKAK
ncbi:MAG: type IV secretion system protein [Alphaproteobacteria bacterium]